MQIVFSSLCWFFTCFLSLPIVLIFYLFHIYFCYLLNLMFFACIKSSVTCCHKKLFEGRTVFFFLNEPITFKVFLQTSNRLYAFGSLFWVNTFQYIFEVKQFKFSFIQTNYCFKLILAQSILIYRASNISQSVFKKTNILKDIFFCSTFLIKEFTVLYLIIID